MILVLAENLASATMCAMCNGLKPGQFEYVSHHGQLSDLAEGRHIWANFDYKDHPEFLKFSYEIKRRKLKLVKPYSVKFS